MKTGGRHQANDTKSTSISNTIIGIHFHRYIRTYSFLVLLSAIPMLLNYLFLLYSGEFLSAKDIYDKQNYPEPHEIIYGSALFNDVSELKLYSYKSKKPQIISFGSSRVLQLRESFFTKPFYNLGSMASSIHQALDVATLLLKEHCPEVIICGVDFWWFNNTYQKPDYHLMSANIPVINKIDPAHLLQPFKWLREGIISVGQYLRFYELDFNPNIGVKGKIKGSGFSSDGTYS